MEKFYDEIEKMYQQVQLKIDFSQMRESGREITAIILGSGLGGFAANVSNAQVLEYHDIPGFPVTTNKGHRGRFVVGWIKESPVIVMEGRVHYYEGYSMKEVVTPIYLLHRMGAKKLILTNAAGGIGEQLEVGDLMMITDHISSFVPSPLIGKNEERFGTRFPDMTQVFDLQWQEKLKKCAQKMQIDLKEGIYLQTTGPNYETPAEIRMYQTLGADAVGMSTVCEAMVANYLKMKICGISCITNKAAGLSGKQLNDEEVKEVAAKSGKALEQLIIGILI